MPHTAKQQLPHHKKAKSIQQIINSPNTIIIILLLFMQVPLSCLACGKVQVLQNEHEVKGIKNRFILNNASAYKRRFQSTAPVKNDFNVLLIKQLAEIPMAEVYFCSNCS